jgi:hypothetical protein
MVLETTTLPAELRPCKKGSELPFTHFISYEN